MLFRGDPPMFKHLIRTASLLAVITLSSIVFGQTSAQVKTVKLTPEVAEGEVGQQFQFSFQALDADGKAVDAKANLWVALPSDLAAVDPTGKISFFAPGEVRIIALVAGKPGIARIKIKPARVTRIEIGKLSASLVPGGTIKLEAKAIGANGDPREDLKFSWSSENLAIAVVDAAGLVTGVAPGKVKLTAKAEGASGELTVEVVKNNIRSVAIGPRTTEARTGDVIHFGAEAKDSDGKAIKNAAIRWSVSGEGATIGSDGGFVAEKPGTYAVTAAAGEQSGVSTVVITPRDCERSLDLVGRIKLKDMEAAEQWLFGNYIYISTVLDQVQVYEISDPKNPKHTDTIKVDARTINDISVTPDAKIGVLTREGASNRKNGIVFLDTSDPAHPKIVSEFTETVTGGVHSAFIDQHYVYLTDDATGSLRVIDFSDMKKPKEVARWQTEPRGPKVSDSIAGIFGEGRYLHDVQVKDGLAYLAYWRDGLVILDVGNGIKGGSPEKPQLVSQLRFNHNELYGDGWLAGTHEVYRYKNYVFVGDEVFPAQFDITSKKRIPSRGVLHVVDVSDIFNPHKVAEYAVPEGGAHNVWVKDDILVMGFYAGGGRVLDVSGELRGDLYRQGREISRLWTGDEQGYRPNIPFAWGARQFGDYIYFNDINSGIWITKLGEPMKKGSTTTPGY
jgi:hypothetical protein